MSVIEAAMVRCKTMADGSLRLECEVEPRNAQAAFALFGAPGRAVALAALVDGAGAVQEPDAGKSASEKPKGGEWAKQAGMWCGDSDFWNFLRNRGYIATNAEEAAKALRDFCEINSRADLDHDAEALSRYNELIRYPFMKYMQARGIQK